MQNRPIGIFDSGVGGLTVCKAINDALPNEDIIYFGDTARFPYGTRSKDTIIRYSRQITDYLLSRDVKLIVVACNTSSAAALETIRDEIKVPIIGVIEAGAKAACKRLEGNIIGVIGTRATVNSESYVKAIKRINPDINIIQQQATLFVSLTEEGMIDNDVAKITIKEYLNGMYGNGVRTLILGCTHFPLLKKSINKIYGDMDLVDTGVEIALEVQNILKEKSLENKNNNINKGQIELYASDITETMQNLKDIFFEKKGTEINKLLING